MPYWYSLATSWVNVASSQEILEAYGPIGVEVIRNSIPKVTGKTAASVRYEVDINRLTIFGRAFFRALETGRSPRTTSKNGDFKDNLEEWLKAKGFATKRSKSGTVYYKLGDQWFSAKSLAWKINKEGDKTFRQGGKEVYFNQVEKFLAELTDKITKSKTEEYTKQVTKLMQEAVA